MEIGIGIHGEPGRSRVPLAPAEGRRRDAARADPGRPGLHRRRRRAAPSSTAWAPRRCSSCTSCTTRSRRSCEKAGRHRWRARWSATTSPAWTWPAARSPCSRLDDELLRLWDAPVSTPALRWGRVRRGGGRTGGTDRRARRLARREFADAVAEHQDELTAARLGDRRRRPRRQHRPRDEGRGRGARRRRRRTTPGALLKTRRDDAGQHGRRGQRPALRHVLPADGAAAGRRADAGRRRVGRGAPGRRSDGVVARGKAEPGDKTMLDALAPAVDALRRRAGRRAATRRGAAGRGGRAAARAADATVPLWPARAGRATWASAASATRIPAPRRRALLLAAAAAAREG